MQRIVNKKNSFLTHSSMEHEPEPITNVEEQNNFQKGDFCPFEKISPIDELVSEYYGKIKDLKIIEKKLVEMGFDIRQL